MDISTIISIILAFLAIVLGAKWILAKELLKEIAEALTVTSDAVQDNKITRKELKRMIEEYSDVVEVAKELFERGYARAPYLRKSN